MGFGFSQSNNYDSSNKSTICVIYNYSIGNCDTSKVSIGPCARMSKEDWQAVSKERKNEILLTCIINNSEKVKAIFESYVDGTLHPKLSLDGVADDQKEKIIQRRKNSIYKSLNRLKSEDFDLHSLLPSRN